MLAAGVALTIVAGYGLALWWLLRREQAWTFTALALLCGLSLALRLVFTDGYPFGLFEDEPKMLGCSVQALQRGAFFGESCIHVPYLFMTVFGATLVPYIGATRWAMRGYPILASVLATPAIFGAARAWGLRVGPSLAAGTLVAVLPWSIFYGRVALGGELILHEALLLAGLGRLVMTEESGPADALLAGFALCLLLYDYWAGRAMMAMPLVAAVLARGRRRAWSLAVIPIALVGWYPHLATGPADALVGLSLATSRGAPLAGSFHPGFRDAPLQTLYLRTTYALRTFVWPVAYDSIFTMRSVAMHPPLILALAALGLFTSIRRGLFLLAGFAVGLVPGIASSSAGISAHRIMMSYLFVTLAAAAALNLPWRWPRRTASAALIAFAAVWCIPLYFSARFWPPDWRWTVDSDTTALREAVIDLAPERLVVMRQLGYYGFLDPPPQFASLLTVDNWLPPDHQPATYVFTWQAEPLRAQYEHLLPGRVRPIGRQSFLVNFEGADWTWLRRYGWAYEARCGDRVHTAQVPFVYNLGVGIESFTCGEPVTSTWRAHWSGPPTEMTLQFTGRLTLAARGLSMVETGFERRVAFRMPADSDLTIRVLSPVGETPQAVLLEQSPGGARAPAWESFRPVWEADSSIGGLDPVSAAP